MKAGIIGYTGSGRDTIFRALTGLPTVSGLNEHRVGEAVVEDNRLDFLSSIFKPKKHTPAKVELFLTRPHVQKTSDVLKISLEKLRDADVLLMVARNFSGADMEKPDPAKDIANLESELLVTDYVIVEKRLERIRDEKHKGKKNDPVEIDLLNMAKTILENNVPLRSEPKITSSSRLRGFGLVSAKPLLLIVNNPDEGDDNFKIDSNLPQLVLRGNLEAEISRLNSDDSKEFLTDYGISDPGRVRVVKTIYELMDLISFFTVGDDECRAWTINKGEDALSAAGKIHSDIKKGFIRAEVVAFSDFKLSGSFAEAKKKGLFRLEGKTYLVADGDIMHFRFNI
jgi:ribosome-binding ATPase YchF (GTP1/OBG family)